MGHQDSSGPSNGCSATCPICPTHRCGFIRLLHSPSLMAIEDSQWGKRHGLQIGWHHPFIVGWFKYRLGLPSAPLHYGLTWPVGIEFPPFFRPQWQSLCTTLTAGICLPLGLCKGTVKESMALCLESAVEVFRTHIQLCTVYAVCFQYLWFRERVSYLRC